MMPGADDVAFATELAVPEGATDMVADASRTGELL
jgi:hypothetical protein